MSITLPFDAMPGVNAGLTKWSYGGYLSLRVNGIMENGIGLPLDPRLGSINGLKGEIGCSAPA